MSSATLVQRSRSTLNLARVHLLHVLSNSVGDDVLGRWIRRGVFRSAGASIPSSAHIHGGTYFSRPANLQVGDRCLITRGCHLDLFAPVVLHDDVVVGPGTTILTAVHQIGPAARRNGAVTDGRPVVIETGVWVAANVTILPGVTIGRGAVVAAGAVVTRDVPPGLLVAGVPATVLRRLDDGQASVPAVQDDDRQAWPRPRQVRAERR